MFSGDDNGIAKNERATGLSFFLLSKPNGDPVKRLTSCQPFNAPLIFVNPINTIKGIKMDV
jgi:hypothetical protein